MSRDDEIGEQARSLLDPVFDGISSALANPARTWTKETLVEFRELLLEPGIDWVPIAQDLLEECEATLDEASAEIAREEETWHALRRADTADFKTIAHGVFPLADRPVDLSVHWKVVQQRDNVTGKHRYVKQLDLFCNGVHWIETSSGPSVPMQGAKRAVKRDVVEAYESTPILTVGGESFVDAVLEVVKVAWRSVQVLKVCVMSPALSIEDVLTALRQTPCEECDGTGKKTTYPAKWGGRESKEEDCDECEGEGVVTTVAIHPDPPDKLIYSPLRQAAYRNPPGNAPPPADDVKRVRGILAERADHEERCDEVTPCPGWAVFEVNRRPWIEIETCDECNSIARGFGKPELADDEVAQLPEAQRMLAERRAEMDPSIADIEADVAQDEDQGEDWNNLDGVVDAREAAGRRGPYKQNPPWVTHALADAFESLSSQVPPAWMPKLEDVRGGPKGTLVAELKEYGCGMYGCVLPTLDPAVVLKVTTDSTESQFAAQLAADLVAPICVEYYMAVSLAATHEKRPIYLLWRESADDVGEVDRVLGPDAETVIGRQHKIAQEAYLALHRKQLELARSKLREWERAVSAMGDEVPELRTLALGLLRVYKDQRVFFGDIHAGNLGRVFRGGDIGEWVITDPGNVAVIR